LRGFQFPFGFGQFLRVQASLICFDFAIVWSSSAISLERSGILT
jgi:hypothetical protein